MLITYVTIILTNLFIMYMKYDYMFFTLVLKNLPSVLAIMSASVGVFTYEDKDSKKMRFVYLFVALVSTYLALSNL